MTPAVLSPLSVLIAACALSAWALARGWSGRMWPFYRPVAWLLTFGLVSDLTRAGIQATWLRTARAMLGAREYVWPERAAFFCERALFLAWPFAILGAAAAVFLRRRTWALLPAWLVVVTGYAASYPWLRAERLRVADAILWSAMLVAYVWICQRSWRAGDTWIAHHVALHWIVSAEVGITAFVLWWPAPTANWGLARVAAWLAYGILLAYQIARLRRS